MQHAFRTWTLLALLALLAGTLPAQVARGAGNFVVTKTADTSDGTCDTDCSLREAITAANAASGGTISFAITAGALPGGYWSISIGATPLPSLTGGSITIDGSTQPGGRSDGGPKIEIRGTSETFGSGLTITSANNLIRSLIINGFSFGQFGDCTTIGIIGDCATGVTISGNGATGNALYGNYIGTDYTGSAAVRNFVSGVAIINGAKNNTVGAVGAGNIIAGNGGSSGRPQLLLGNSFLQSSADKDMTGNVVAGNYIGVGVDGRSVPPGTSHSRSHGVWLFYNALSNTIGPGNIISGNGANATTRAYGVVLDGQVASNAPQTNRVIGNYIGLNIDGNAAANRNGGIQVFLPDSAVRGSNNTIGGPSPGDRNYISGNNESGILIDAGCRAEPATSTVVQNNVIGLNSAGAARPNTLSGVRLTDDVSSASSADLGACRHQIGPDNVISGNGGDGVLMRSVTATNPTTLNVVRGNYIGTSINGSSSVANGAYGIRLEVNTTANVVGGSTTANQADRNLISSNQAGGILIDRSPNNLVQGNVIVGHTNASSLGVDLQGSASTGNQIIGNAIGASGGSNEIGLRITGGANGNTIGAGNDIAFNLRYGIEITGAGTNNNQITQNSAHDNGIDGILVASGTGNRITQTTTRNNGGDPGKGINLSLGAQAGNGGRAAPTLSITPNSPTSATLNGTSTCGAGCTVEIFTGDAAEPSEGNIYLSSTTTDNTGAFSLALPISGCKPYLIATITDGAGNTSEFSNTVGPTSACVPAAPGIVLTKDTPDVSNAAAGTTYTYNHTLTNNGTAQGTYTVGFSSSQGWGVLVPETTSYIILAGRSETIQVVVTVPIGATAGASDSSTITAVLAGGGSASQTDVTTVQQRFDFSFTPPALTSPSPVLPGQFIRYDHTITNLGNGSDSFTFSFSNSALPASAVVIDAPNCQNVAAGNSCNVGIIITVPTSSPPPSDVVTVVATSKDGVTTRQVVDTTQIQQVAVPVISPATLSDAGKPGTSVQLVHTLTNAGGASGTFTVVVPSDLGDGWTATVQQPVPNTFAPGDSRQFTVIVNIPPYDPANPATYSGSQKTVQVTVPASGVNPAAVPANDTVTVSLAPAATITPSTRSEFAAPNQVIDFRHDLNNTGNGAETFDLTAQPPAALAGWAVVFIDPTTGEAITALAVARAASRPFIVRVTVPSGAVDTQSYDVGVRATARSDASVQASATETITIRAGAVPLLNGALAGSTDPGVALPLAHTIQNVGNAAGSFDITFEGLPAGWSAVANPDPTASLTPNAAAIALEVQITPAADALAGVYRVTVRATAQAPDLNLATTTVVDTITVLQKASLLLTPNYNTSEKPGMVVTYTHTLTNAGNFTDTIGLAISATQPWAVNVLPTSVTLAPKMTALVTVTVSVPPGIVAGLANTATITASSSLPNATAIATDVTTVARAPGLTLTPPLFVNAGEATKPVTFTYTLFNSGSITQGYTLTAAPPSGWNAIVLSGNVQALAPGQTTQVTLVVTAPANTPNGSVGNTTLTAESTEAPHPTATVLARLLVGPAYDVIIAPPRQGNVLPGRVYSYSHTVTNTGLFTDTFLLSTVSLLGWQTSIAPASVSLAPGATSQVTVTVVVPTNAQASVVEITRAYARSATQPKVNPYVEDTSTVLQVASVQVSPRYVSFVEAGTEVVYIHQVTNSGNGPDSFTISVTSSRGWPFTVEQTRTPLLASGVPYPVTIRATVPAGTPKGVTSNLVVRATSTFNGAVFDETINALNAPPIEGNTIILPDASYKQYLPLVVK